MTHAQEHRAKQICLGGCREGENTGKWRMDLKGVGQGVEMTKTYCTKFSMNQYIYNKEKHFFSL